MRYGLPMITRRFDGDAEIVVGIGKVGCQFNGTAVMPQRAGEVAALFHNNSQLIVGTGIHRCEFNSVHKVSSSLFGSAGIY